MMFGDCSFTVTESTVLKSLPNYTKKAPSLDTFKSQLTNFLKHHMSAIEFLNLYSTHFFGLGCTMALYTYYLMQMQAERVRTRHLKKILKS